MIKKKKKLESFVDPAKCKNAKKNTKCISSRLRKKAVFNILKD
jgi:hypothetical protein